MGNRRIYERFSGLPMGHGGGLAVGQYNCIEFWLEHEKPILKMRI